MLVWLRGVGQVGQAHPGDGGRRAVGKEAIPCCQVRVRSDDHGGRGCVHVSTPHDVSQCTRCY